MPIFRINILLDHDIIPCYLYGYILKFKDTFYGYD